MRNLLTALGALTVGAAAMYLSDPEQGRRRRSLLKHRIAAAADEALQALGNTGHQAANRLQEAAAQGRDAASEWLHQAETRAGDAAEAGREAGWHGLERTRGAIRMGRERWQSRSAEAPPDGRGAGLGAALLTVVAGVALGAAAMFALDPRQGRRRLALARDQAVHFGRSGACFAQAGLRDLGHRAKGLSARATQLLHRGTADDVVLVQRVRSALGRVVSHAHALRVSAADGLVTLSGPVLAGERAALLKCVRAVRGVREVRDTLDAHESAGREPALQGGVPRTQPAQAHWAPGPRLLALTGSLALALYAASRRGLPGALAGAAGAGLALRAARNETLRHSLAQATHRRGEELPLGQGAHMAELGAPAQPWHPDRSATPRRDRPSLH